MSQERRAEGCNPRPLPAPALALLPVPVRGLPSLPQAFLFNSNLSNPAPRVPDSPGFPSPRCHPGSQGSQDSGYFPKASQWRRVLPVTCCG